MNKFAEFGVRWVLTAVGFWIILRLFGEFSGDLGAIQTVAILLLAALVFSVVNAIIKPIITVLSLPFVLITMGIFMLIINGFMVWLTLLIVPDVKMSFGWAIISGIVLSLINWLVSNINEMAGERGK